MAKPKLTDAQRLAVLHWLAEGLTNKEINDLAASFEPSFKISPQLIYQYRKDYDIDLQKLRNEKDALALSTGLAIRATRIQKLIDLALLLEEDLRVKELLWTENAKSVGNERYDFKEFNEAEIRQLRGIYDDIAKETGGRVTRTDITSNNKQVKGYVLVSPDDWPDKPE
jgi:hypothetical protein